MLSFLKRKSDKDYGNPLANTLSAYAYPSVGQSQSRNQTNNSQPGQSTQRSTQPYAVQTLADGRVKYSDGSIKGTARNTQNTYQPQQKASPTAPSTTSFVDNYLQQRGNTATQRVSDITSRTQKQQDLQKQLFENNQNTLSDLVGINTDAFNNYASQVRKGVGLQRNTADRQIGDVKADYTDQQYYNEQARKERMKGLEGTLASLGTLQSSALGNIGAKVNMGAERQDRQAQRNMNTRVADIEDAYSMAETEAEGLIQQEAANYQSQIRALSSQMNTNSIEYQQAVEMLQSQANDSINQILDSLDQFAYSAGLEMIKAQNEQDNGLSPQFLTTGQPQTAADYEWMVTNPDKYQQSFVNPSQEQSDAANTVAQIDSILNSDLAPVTGSLRLGSRIPGSQAYDTKRQIDNIKSKLQLAAAGQLQGQGTLSDSERRILADAATALDYGMSEEAFRAELNKVRQVFANQAGRVASTGSSTTNSQLLQQFGG